MVLATLATASSAVASEASSSAPSLVRDINPGSSSSVPQQFASIGDRLLFSATDGVHGSELWVSDGTTGGTHLVKDINPGPEGSDPRHGTPSAPNNFISNVGGRPYFNAYDPVHGYEPWTSNGTAADTHLVKDIRPGDIASYASDFTYAHGIAFFTAADEVYGRTLWRTDGTAGGTRLVTDSHGRPLSLPSYLTNFDGSLFFSAADKLWRSDGTAAGTSPVAPSQLNAWKLKKVGNTLFVVAGDHPALWKSDGTTAGTKLVSDHRGWESYPNHLTGVGDTLFFDLQDAAHGFELWRSDGTPNGTELVRDIRPGSGSSRPDCLTAVDQTLFFKAYNAGLNSDDLWRSDGTAAGTTRVMRSLYCADGTLRNVGGTLFFSAFDGRGVELWKVAP